MGSLPKTFPFSTPVAVPALVNRLATLIAEVGRAVTPFEPELSILIETFWTEPVAAMNLFATEVRAALFTGC